MVSLSNHEVGRVEAFAPSLVPLTTRPNTRNLLAPP
jgi:hypothetical protein